MKKIGANLSAVIVSSKTTWRDNLTHRVRIFEPEARFATAAPVESSNTSLILTMQQYLS